MPSTETPFTIEDWEPHAVDEFSPDLALGRVSFRKTYKGDDLVGTAVATMLNCGQVAYTAMERITGALAGRTGSFVLMHGATADTAGATGAVVPGSGTDELVGLTGTVSIRHEDGGGPVLVLDWSL
jgi:hypothetical protein